MHLQQQSPPAGRARSSWPAFLLTAFVAVVMLLGPTALQAALGATSQDTKSEKSSVIVLGGQAPSWTVSVDLGEAGYECYTQLGELLQDETVRCTGGHPSEQWSFTTDWREGFADDQNELVLRRSLRASTHLNIPDDLAITQRDVPGDDKLKVLVSDPISSAGDKGEAQDVAVLGFIRPDEPGAMVLVTLKGEGKMSLASHENLLIANARLEDD